MAEFIIFALVLKIKQSDAFPWLTDEVIGVSNISQLVSFFKYFVLETGKADIDFITCFSLLRYLHNTFPNADATASCLTKM